MFSGRNHHSISSPLSSGIPLRGFFDEMALLGIKHRKWIIFLGQNAERYWTLDLNRIFLERYVEFQGSIGNAIGQAMGFSLAGKTPFIFADADSLCGRSLDLIRQAVSEPGFNIRFIGLEESPCGGQDYSLENLFPSLKVFSPSNYESARAEVREIAEHHGPCYVRLSVV